MMPHQVIALATPARWAAIQPGQASTVPWTWQGTCGNGSMTGIQATITLLIPMTTQLVPPAAPAKWCVVAVITIFGASYLCRTAAPTSLFTTTATSGFVVFQIRPKGRRQKTKK